MMAGRAPAALNRPGRRGVGPTRARMGIQVPLPFEDGQTVCNAALNII